MPPYAKILLSKNGADPVEGPITVALGDTIQPIPESTAYWTDPPAVWRIKAWPKDWPAPAGWTYNSASRSYEFVGNGTPPAIPVTSTVGLFGKWLLDLVVMGGILEEGPDPSLIHSVGWKLLSPKLGLSGIALWENNQFDSAQLWPGEATSDFQKIEQFAATLGAPSEAAFVAGKQQTSETTAVALVTRKFNPSLYNADNRTITFLAWLEAAAGATAHLELYNLTTTSTVHTFTSTAAAGELKSQVLSVPGNLPNSANNYVLRLWRSGGSPGDIVSCHSAYLEISYQ